MKYIKRLLFVVVMFLLLSVGNVRAEERLNLYLFHSETCVHCKSEIDFLESIKDDYPNLVVHLLETTRNKENNALMNVVKKAVGTNSPLVPFTIIGTNYYIGYSEDTENKILDSIDEFMGSDVIDVVNKVNNGESVKDVKFNNGDITEITLPLLGKVDPRKVALPFVAILIGTVDGFNPCAMWVLIFLISMLFNMKNRKRMWVLGITFLVSSAIVYLFFMVAWLNLAGIMMNIIWLRLLIALIALVGAYLNIASYFKSLKKDNGCEVVDDKKRKKLMTKIKKIATEKSFWLAFLGIIFLAFSVNLIELACSAGLPLLFTQILALNNLNPAMYAVYIFIYILFFLLDDIIIFVIAMITLNISGISTKFSKYSHLVGGIIMLLIGLLMAFKPEWLMFNFG